MSLVPCTNTGVRSNWLASNFPSILGQSWAHYTLISQSAECCAAARLSSYWKPTAQHWRSFSVWNHFHRHSTQGRGNLLFRQRDPHAHTHTLAVQSGAGSSARVRAALCLWCHHNKKESSPRLIFFSLVIFLGICTTIQKGNRMLLLLFFWFLFAEQIFDRWREDMQWKWSKVNNKHDQNDIKLPYFE